MYKKLISIILPVYNQADHIKEIITHYEEALFRIPYRHELLLVVNGCKDRSLKICQQLAEKYEAVKVLENEKKGWARAVKLGLKEAKGDLLCYTNSARTAPKDLVLFVLYAFANPESVIKANRKIRDSLTRRIGSLLYNIECRTLFDLSYWDVNGTPKVFPRECAKLLALKRDDDLIDLEFNVVCRQNDYPMLEIPTFSPKRHGGRSTTGFQSALKMYLGAFLMKRSQK